MKIIKFSLLTIIALIFIVLCVVNREVVSISFFPVPYSFEVPVFILALSCIMFGVVITGIFMNIRSIKNRALLHSSKKRIAAMENENKSLRSEREQSLPALPKQ